MWKWVKNHISFPVSEPSARQGVVTTSMMYNPSVTMADTWAGSSNESSHICPSPTQLPPIYLVPIDHLLTLSLGSPLTWHSGNTKIVASLNVQKDLLNPTWFLLAGFDQSKEPINPSIRGRVWSRVYLQIPSPFWELKKRTWKESFLLGRSCKKNLRVSHRGASFTITIPNNELAVPGCFKLRWGD